MYGKKYILVNIDLQNSKYLSIKLIRMWKTEMCFLE